MDNQRQCKDINHEDLSGCDMKKIVQNGSGSKFQNHLGIQADIEFDQLQHLYALDPYACSQFHHYTQEKISLNKQRQNEAKQTLNHEYFSHDNHCQNEKKCIEMLCIDESNNSHYQNNQGELFLGSTADGKIFGSSSEASFDQQSLGYGSSEDYDKCSNFQKNPNITFNKQKNQQFGLNQQCTALMMCNGSHNANYSDVGMSFANKRLNESQSQGYFYSLYSPKSSALTTSFFQDASTNKQYQKQYLLEQGQEASNHCWGIPPQANLNNQLKEKVFENYSKVSKFGVKLSNRSMIGMIQNKMCNQGEEGDNQSSLVYVQQNEGLYDNFDGNYNQNYQNGQSWNIFSNGRVEGGVENAYCNFQKNQENYQALNEMDQMDEDLIYFSDKLLPSNLTHNFEETKTFLNNRDELAQNLSDHPFGQPQLLQMSREEQHYAYQIAHSSDLQVENQGELTYLPFPQSQINNWPLDSQQQKFNQITKIESKMFQEQYQCQSNQQIDPSSDGQNNLQQQIHQLDKRIKNECSSLTNKSEDNDLDNIESCSSINNSRNNKSNSMTDKTVVEELSESQVPNKAISDQNQETKDSKSNDNIVDQVSHLNKKNIVRNLIRAFKKYFLNKKATPQACLQFFPDQSLEISRNQFKQYFSNKKLNNSSLKQLIIHPTYGEVFNFFLQNKSNEYLDHSNIKTKESHEIFINYLVLCYSDPQQLTILETYSKL